MKISALFASKVGFLALLIFIALFGSYADVPPTQWLSQTFLGLAFGLAFDLSFPIWLAYTCVGAIFILIFSVGFYLSKPIFEKLDNDCF